MARQTAYERLKSHKQRMIVAGFQNVQFFASAHLVDYILQQRLEGECRGRTLERLLLGSAQPRPDYWSAQERSQREQRRAANKENHKTAQANKEAARLAGKNQ